MTTDYLLAVSQLALGTVYLHSYVGKIIHMSSFLRGVKEYQILPSAITKPFGIVVVVAEAALCVTHISGLGLGLAAAVGVALLTMFSIAIAINLVKNRKIACHCSAQDDTETISFRSLVRLGLMISAELSLVVVYGLSSSTIGLSRVLSNDGDVFLLLGWSMLVLQAALWLLRLNDIFRLFARVVPAIWSQRAA